MLAEVTDLLIPIDPSSPEPLNRQVYQGIREAILSGHMGRACSSSAMPTSASIPSHGSRAGLVLGYAGAETASIAPALERLAAAVRACARRSD